MAYIIPGPQVQCDWLIPYESSDSVLKKSLATTKSQDEKVQKIAAKQELSPLKLGKTELLLHAAPFKNCHASTIVETAPQELLVAFFGGTKEGANDVAIWACKFEAGKWGAPFELARADGLPCWNPVLVQMPEGELLLFYKVGPDPRSWHGMVKRSKDGGKSWSDPERLPKGIYGPIKNKPLLLSDNKTLVCPSSEELPPREASKWFCQMEITSDNAKSWEKSAPIEYEETESQPLKGIIQPTLFQDNEGVLHMLCRSKNVGWICEATSKDNGRHWSQITKTTLENPNCGIDAVTLKDGRVVLLYNPIQAHRNKLALALSDDGGKTWQKQYLMLEDHGSGEYSYPAIIQTSDGLIHAVYTWKRTNIKHVIIVPEK